MVKVLKNHGDDAGSFSQYGNFYDPAVSCEELRLNLYELVDTKYGRAPIDMEFFKISSDSVDNNIFDNLYSNQSTTSA